jgi:hypothetical protein
MWPSPIEVVSAHKGLNTVDTCINIIYAYIQIEYVPDLNKTGMVDTEHSKGAICTVSEHLGNNTQLLETMQAPRHINSYPDSSLKRPDSSVLHVISQYIQRLGYSSLLSRLG